MKSTFNNIDFIDNDGYVFNIKGNDFRYVLYQHTPFLQFNQIKKWTSNMAQSKIVDKEVLLKSFPSTLKEDIEKVVDILSFDKDHLFSPDSQIILLDEEVLNIPCRIYFDEPSSTKEECLTDQQKTILNCIFLRHHDGFVRQRRLELLVDKTEYFITPFTFQLLGEYVIEILFVLEKHINEKTIGNYLKFIRNNKKYWFQTESRVISYWDAYYRRAHYQDHHPSKYANLKDYIGQQIISKIKKANS